MRIFCGQFICLVGALYHADAVVIVVLIPGRQIQSVHQVWISFLFYAHRWECVIYVYNGRDNHVRLLLSTFLFALALLLLPSGAQNSRRPKRKFIFHAYRCDFYWAKQTIELFMIFFREFEG